MKIRWNKEYTTISIYAIVVFFMCLLLYKITISWSDTQAFFSNLSAIISPFVIGLILAYFINPLIKRFEEQLLKNKTFSKDPTKNKHIKRGLSILTSYIILLTFFIVLLAIILPQLYKSISDFSTFFDPNSTKLMEQISNLSIDIAGTEFITDKEMINKYITDNLSYVMEQIPLMIGNFVPSILSLLNDFATIVINLFIGVIISIYVLSSKEHACEGAKKIIIALFSKKNADSIFETLSYSHKVFSNFFIGKLIDSLIVALFCFAILTVFRIDFALLISVLVGITNIIPYFGPFIGGAVGFGLLIFVNPFKALIFFIIIIILQQIDGNILGPMILGDSLKLSPFWIIFSIILFGSIFGIPGMFFGAPLFSVIKSIIDKKISKLYLHRIKKEYDHDI